MREAAQKPDVQRVLAGLKDFQQHTVERVFQRMYVDDDATRRFLVADEVGLGKTMVARGVIARAIDKLWNEVEQIDIVYICSNADIARQNVNRLNVTTDSDVAIASRITLLPVRLQQLKGRRLNFISFTPGTSFELKSSLGQLQERVLLYWLLKDAWNLRGVAALNVFQGAAGRENFRKRVDNFRPDGIEQGLADDFRQAILKAVARDRSEGRPDLRSRFEALCERVGRRQTFEPEDWTDMTKFIGELRDQLARTCLDALQPDLIVLDEFQRFKHLLDGEDQASQLARDLFEYKDARVLLLSATPYKMYTLDHESDTDDHYKDFLRTIRFLYGGTPGAGRVEQLLAEFRREVLRADAAGRQRLIDINRELSECLRKVMVRTERLAVSADRSGMLVQKAPLGVHLEERDLDGWLDLQRVTRELEQGDSMEHWKAAPYLLNFMEDYALKRAFDKAATEGKCSGSLAVALAKSRAILLSWQDVRGYREVDPANARLRSLVHDTIGRGAWKLLWLPPSLPYYQLEGPYADPALASFTKRLVFSSWRMVPKVIATLLSYEAERLMVRSLEAEPENSPEARKKRGSLLRFVRSEGRLGGMPVLGLVYPAVALARATDPLELAREQGNSGHLPSAAELQKTAAERVATILATLPQTQSASGPVDESWYWAAPVLLDLQGDGDRLRAWLERGDLGEKWSDRDGGDEAEGRTDTHWEEHVQELRRLVKGELTLGTPPQDLAEVVATLGLASPGCCVLRALARIVGWDMAAQSPEVRTRAASGAFGFLTLFNLPEVSALVRGMNRAEPYWRRVLEHGLGGGLQAVLDEYLHVLRDTVGLIDKAPERTARELTDVLRQALSLRTARLGVHEIGVKGAEVRQEARGMRARFAVRFGDETPDDGGEPSRGDQVRAAFNSPFWPFVLATTSVGQEGLDFHPYCHAVVHWNLPSNPVDLEQREGRVHRYKGHAIRRNVALKHGPARGLDAGDDPWRQLFDRAVASRGNQGDLVPFWIYPVEGRASIERHVPALPLSRETDKLASLRQSLAVYRMVFGQARQEELLEYLKRHVPEAEIPVVAEMLRIDLGPVQSA